MPHFSSLPSTTPQAGDKTLVYRGGVIYQVDADGLGGGGAGVEEITQAAYDALDPPDPDTIYVITDAGPVYLTQAEYDAIVTPDPNRLYVIIDPINPYPLLTSGSHTWMHFPGQMLAAGWGGVTYTNNRLYYEPFTLTAPIQVTALGLNISVGGAGTCRMGLARLGGDFQPTALMGDAGTVDISTTGLKSITGLSIDLSPGVYAKLRISNVDYTANRTQVGMALGSDGARQWVRDRAATTATGQHTALSHPLPNHDSSAVDWDSPMFHCVYMKWVQL